MNIMKTKIRTLLAICVLGFIGLININAITDNKKTVNNEVISEKAEMLTIELPTTEDAFIESAEAMTALEVDEQIEKYATKQILLEENAKSDFLNLAESYTVSGVDHEIEKYAMKQISLQKDRIRK
jgi:hypothetical protein